MPEEIIQAVMDTIAAIEAAFEATPTFFYTETDLVCWFSAELNRRLPEEYGMVTDVDGLPHRLVHTEYPTPFRCDMAGGGFRVVSNDERTPRGGLYRRGHLDIVVLHPNFVAAHGYDVLNAQDYRVFQAAVLHAQQMDEPLLLFAVELFFSRRRMNHVAPAAVAAAADGIAAQIRQDANKLIAAAAMPGFVENIRHLAFVKGANGAVRAAIEAAFEGNGVIQVTCA